MNNRSRIKIVLYENFVSLLSLEMFRTFFSSKLIEFVFPFNKNKKKHVKEFLELSDLKKNQISN